MVDFVVQTCRPKRADTELPSDQLYMDINILEVERQKASKAH